MPQASSHQVTSRYRSAFPHSPPVCAQLSNWVTWCWFSC